MPRLIDQPRPLLWVVADLDAPRTVRLVTPVPQHARDFYWSLKDAGRTPICVCDGERVNWLKR